METAQHSQSKKFKTGEYLCSIYPLLDKISIDALFEMEELYQKAAHDRFYVIPLENHEEIVAEVAKIKGARDFILFLRKLKAEAGKAVNAIDGGPF